MVTNDVDLYDRSACLGLEVSMSVSSRDCLEFLFEKFEEGLVFFQEYTRNEFINTYLTKNSKS